MNDYSIITLTSINKRITMQGQEQKFDKTIDENKTRIDAAIIAVLIMAYLFTGFTPILLVLLYDFAVRLYVTPWLSPVFLLSRYLLTKISFQKRIGDADSKKFAANIALAVVLFILAADFGASETWVLVLTLFLAVWKILEASKNICFGCAFYALLKRYNIEIVAL